MRLYGYILLSGLLSPSSDRLNSRTEMVSDDRLLLGPLSYRRKAAFALGGAQ